MDKKEIIIYGGSFNPPHIGHVIAIETAARIFPCDEIWIMPSADRRDKKLKTSSADRIKMLELITKEQFSGIRVPILISRLELDRSGITRTYDTMKGLKARLPNNKFYLLIGSDIVGDIKDRWAEGQYLFEHVNFLIFDFKRQSLPAELPRHAHILHGDIAYIDVSSTFIRELLHRGYSGLPYLTPKVAEYITAHKLY